MIELFDGQSSERPMMKVAIRIGKLFVGPISLKSEFRLINQDKIKGYNSHHQTAKFNIFKSKNFLDTDV